MSVQIKAYLYEGRACRSKEIRRFTIDQDVSTNYEYLRRKVSSVFPNLGDNFSLQWRDSDGDLIWFNSDEELLMALSQHTEGDFKLYIKEQSGEGSQQCSGPKFCGPRYPRCPPPFGFGFNPGLFANFAAFKPDADKTTEENSEKPSTSKPEEKSQSNQPGAEYLQEMGKAVAQFLQPFGIDVDINVEHKKDDSSDATKNPEPSTSKDDTTAEESKPAESNSASSPWTIINNEKEEKSKESEDKMEMEVNEDSRLRQSVDRLLGMGFNDHGGWLTNLLKSCDSDIGRALDAMQPNRSKN